MSEVSFAESFLATLATKPQRISPNHIQDPRNYPAQMPYILPRMPNPKRKPQSSSPPSTTDPSNSAAPSSEPHPPASVFVRIRSLRNPPLVIELPTPQPIATTSVLDIRLAVAEQSGLLVDEIKLLFQKKVVGDSKVLQDLLGGESEAKEAARDIEFNVMIMGGAAALEAAMAAKAATATIGEGMASVGFAQGLSGTEFVTTEEFWKDLEGYLSQRVRDEQVAHQLLGCFKSAWEANK